jgi:hypothetical protein
MMNFSQQKCKNSCTIVRLSYLLATSVDRFGTSNRFLEISWHFSIEKPDLCHSTSACRVRQTHSRYTINRIRVQRDLAGRDASPRLNNRTAVTAFGGTGKRRWAEPGADRAALSDDAVRNAGLVGDTHGPATVPDGGEGSGNHENRSGLPGSAACRPNRSAVRPRRRSDLLALA